MVDLGALTALPPALRAFAATVAGPVLDHAFCGWDHGESRVWRLTHASGQVSYLKVHRRGRKAHQERRAYQEWLPALGEWSPVLLGALEGPPGPALLIAEAPGSLATDARWSRADRQEIARQAGAFLSAFRATAGVDDDPMSLEEALRRRMSGWLPRARLSASAQGEVTRRFERGASFEGASRTRCHRDFQPRNWVVHRTGGALRLRVIDFEHAAMDAGLIDMLKLRDDSWRDPTSREAFLEGLDAPHGEEEEARLERLMLLHGVATLAWSLEHNDLTYEAHGRAILAALKIPESR